MSVTLADVKALFNPNNPYWDIAVQYLIDSGLYSTSLTTGAASGDVPSTSGGIRIYSNGSISGTPKPGVALDVIIASLTSAMGGSIDKLSVSASLPDGATQIGFFDNTAYSWLNSGSVHTAIVELANKINSIDTSGSGGGSGAQGPQGEPGSQGPQGIQGVTGAQGAQGTQGSTGSQGDTGPQGFQGNQGLQGSQGSTGSQGPQGDVGSQGNQGNPGAQGSQGLQGSIGSQGSQGFQGLQGSTGSQGPQGDPGAQGNQGFQGVVGSQGNQGNQGFQGSQGNIGSQGSQGFQGSVGNQGAQGFQGSQGLQGSVGAQGNQGFQGVQGSTGSQGPQGNQGVQGSQAPTSLIIGLAVDYTTTGDILLSGSPVQANGTWSTSLTDGQRVLVKDNTPASENGVYTTSSGPWTRATDFDSTLNIFQYTYFLVTSGTTLDGSGWILATPPPYVVNTTSLDFTKMFDPGSTTVTTSGSTLSWTPPTSSSDGMWMTYSGLYVRIDGVTQRINSETAQYYAYTSITSIVENTATPTTILPGYVKLSILEQSINNIINITFDGFISFNSLSNTVNLNFLLDGVSIDQLDILGSDITGSATSALYHVYGNLRLSFQTVNGSSATSVICGILSIVTSSGQNDFEVYGSNVVNTTKINNFDILATWSTSAINNHISTYAMQVQHLNSLL